MRYLVLCLVVAVFALMGCQQAQEAAETATEGAAEEAMEGMQEEGMPEEMAMMDPVCGMEVTEESEWTAEYDGKTFYFCSETCRDNFVKEPGKYLEAMGEEVMGT